MYSEDILSAYDVWGGSSTGDWALPPITMTAEEAEVFSRPRWIATTLVHRSVPA